jgi:hypothetical protein
MHTKDKAVELIYNELNKYGLINSDNSAEIHSLLFKHIKDIFDLGFTEED